MTDDNTESSGGIGRRDAIKTGAAVLLTGSTAGCVGTSDGGVPAVDEPIERFINNGKTRYQGRVNNLASALEGEHEDFSQVNRALEKGQKATIDLAERDDTAENNKVTFNGGVVSDYSLDRSVYSKDHGRGVEVAPGVAIAPINQGGEIERKSSVQDDGEGATLAEFSFLPNSESVGTTVQSVAESVGGLSQRQREMLQQTTNELSDLGIYFEAVNENEDTEQPIFPREAAGQLEKHVAELETPSNIYQHIANSADHHATRSSNLLHDELNQESGQYSTEVPFFGELWGDSYDPETDLSDVEAARMRDTLRSMHNDSLDLYSQAVKRLAEVETLKGLAEHALKEYEERVEDYQRPDQYAAGDTEGEPRDGGGSGPHYEDLDSLNAATDDRDLTRNEVEAFADSPGYTGADSFDFQYDGGAVDVLTETGEKIGTIAGDF